MAAYDAKRARTGFATSEMTLNITLAARWMLVQSSDFRLTKLGTLTPLSDTAQKQFVLHYLEWSGLLCYTGIAEFGRHSTADWLSNLLEHEHGERSRDEVIRTIVTEGNRWLGKVPLLDRFHTFTLATFEGKAPLVTLISTFERGGGPVPDNPGRKLMVTHLKPRGPRTIVTGQSPLVTDRPRAELERALARKTDPLHLRLKVALASRSTSGPSNGTVGEACIVSHMLPDGSGEAQVFGNTTASFVPSLIVAGNDLARTVPHAVNQAGTTGPHRLVGATWNRNGEMGVMLGAYREIAKQTGDGWPDYSAGVPKPAVVRYRPGADQPFEVRPSPDDGD